MLYHRLHVDAKDKYSSKGTFTYKARAESPVVSA